MFRREFAGLVERIRGFAGSREIFSIKIEEFGHE